MNRVVIITCGAKGIGKCIAEVSAKEGHADVLVASDKAGFITDENICVDGGMTRQMIYHNDFGWRKECQS